jgi:hypothetical protein
MGILIAIVNGALVGGLTGVFYDIAAAMWMDETFDVPMRGIPGALLGLLSGMLAGAFLRAWGGVVIGALQGSTFGAILGAWVGGIFGSTGGARRWAGTGNLHALLIGAAAGPLAGMVAGTMLLGGTVTATILGALLGLFIGPLVGAATGLVGAWLRDAERLSEERDADERG